MPLSVPLPPVFSRTARTFGNVSRGILQSLYEFVFPPVCYACDRYLPETESKICPECLSSIAPVRREDASYNEMRERLRSGGVIDDLASAFYFEKGGALQTLIHQLKYEETTVIGIELGKQLGVALPCLLGALPDACLVPVPLHSAKKRERGYNQSEHIVRGMHAVTGLPIAPDLLIRKKNTATQTQLNRAERLANVKEAFAMKNNRRAEGASFILVDDVITSGATIMECARVLKRHGAAHVFAASIALAAYTVDGEA